MIIGITGTNGSGKGTVVEYLVSHKTFNHFSVRSFLIEELQRLDLPIDRPNMRDIANDMRKAHGPAYVVEELMKKALEVSSNSVIESIRTIGEAEFLKSKGAILWATDADKKTRYERVLLRQSETDRVSFEQFCIYEDREMVSEEPWDMNVFAVMKMSDQIFQNNESKEDLFAQVESKLF